MLFPDKRKENVYVQRIIYAALNCGFSRREKRENGVAIILTPDPVLRRMDN